MDELTPTKISNNFTRFIDVKCKEMNLNDFSVVNKININKLIKSDRDLFSNEEIFKTNTPIENFKTSEFTAMKYVQLKQMSDFDLDDNSIENKNYLNLNLKISPKKRISRTPKCRLILDNEEYIKRERKYRTLEISLSDNENSIQSIKNLNINININNILNYPKKEKKRKSEKIENFGMEKIITPKIHKNSNTSEYFLGSPANMRWRKLSNLFKSLRNFNSYETKNVQNEDEIDEEMKDYKSRLFSNTIKMRKSSINEDESTPHGNLFNTQMIKFIQLHEENLSKININNKEEIYRIIIENEPTAISKIDKIIKNDPEYYMHEQGDPNYKFNAPLNNGKTLLYIACHEGRLDIVSYFLDKKINPFIKSKIDEKEKESNLQVACRWNFIKVVNILLERVNFSRENLKEVLELKGLTKNIRTILKKYYKSKFKINKCKCC